MQHVNGIEQAKILPVALAEVKPNCRTTRRIRRKVRVVFYMSFRHRWIAAVS